MNKIKLLPQDIQFHILSYYYKVQNNELLEDIKNFVKVKKDLGDYYFDYYRSVWKNTSFEFEDRNWLINDIILWMNYSKPTIHGYVPFYYNVWKRHIYLLTENKIQKYMNKYLYKMISKESFNIEELIDQYIHIIEIRDVNTQINFYLGMLTTEERNYLTDFLK